MATITALNSAASSTGSSSQASKDLTGFGKDFDSFLVLLTSQLKYQDPLSPMDATQFTTQLVQFTSVEQQIKQNKNLESIMGAQEALQVASASNYIGKVVDAGGKSILLNGGEATISYRLDAPAKEVAIAVKNSSGEIVRTLPGKTEGGLQTVAWDGKSDNGTRLADGTYDFVVTAKDARGQTLSVKTGYSGTIDGFELANGQIILKAGTAKIPIRDITGVRTI
ncbi:MAG: flagellar hook assembly protein FlgD [Alphaproteobacteria bacterium]|nr:flagellar hook assembly protein FlgD [Alphaproteobacteria bacterium]